MNNGNGIDYVDKIGKLLRKAERASTQPEADAFFAKAQSLMVKYAISEQEIADARGEIIDEIVQDTYEFTGIYQQALFNVGHYVGSVNDMRVLIRKRSAQRGYTRYDGTKVEKKPAATILTLIGFSKDVAVAKQLIASLEIQVLQSMKRWWDGQTLEPWQTKMDGFKMRRTFIDGFADEIHTRMDNAKRTAVQEVVQEREAASTAGHDAVSSSVALVLRSRKEKVDEWYDVKYGRRTRTSKAGHYQSGGSGSFSAGKAAGARADIGQTRVGGNRRQIGS